MSYLMFDKKMSKTFQDSLQNQANKLKETIASIEAFCLRANNSNSLVKSSNNDVKSVNIDSNNAFYDIASKVKKDCLKTRSGSLTSLNNLVNAVKSINFLVEEFDKGKNFTLRDAFSDNESIKVVVDEETNQERIYFVDEDGNEILMSELLNSMYTFTGITMDSMVQAAIEAEDGGYVFDEAMQQEIMSDVNSLVGEVKESGAFSLVTEEDIMAVDAQLSGTENYESILGKISNESSNTVNDVGGDVTSSTNVGENALSAYVLSKEPGEFKDVVDTLSNMDEASGGGLIEATGGEAINEIKTPTTLENDNRFSVKPEEFGSPSKMESAGTEIHDNYDDLARQKYESLGEEAISERRIDVITKAEELFKMDDKTQLKAELTKFGYGNEEIEKIIQDSDTTISAMIEGDQRTQMAEYAKEFAELDGVKNFDTKFDDGQSLGDLENGSSSSLLANMSNDENVVNARNDYLQNREVYKELRNEVNESIENANKALDKIESIKANNKVDSYSDWSESTINEYNSAVKEYNDSMSDYNSKLDAFKEAEMNYENSYNNLNQAKIDFENKFKLDSETIINQDIAVTTGPEVSPEILIENDGLSNGEFITEYHENIPISGNTGPDRINTLPNEFEIEVKGPEPIAGTPGPDAYDRINTLPNEFEIEVKGPEPIAGTPGPDGYDRINTLPNEFEIEVKGPEPIAGTPNPENFEKIELVKNEELNFETIFDRGGSIIKPVLPDNEILTPIEENIVGNENLSDDVITTVNLDDVDILKEIDDLIGYNKGENIDGVKLLDNSPILTRPVVDESLEPVMIQPEIKIETANFENVLPELINKEIRIEQMGTGYNPELFDKE